jgi:hypothetical protein
MARDPEPSASAHLIADFELGASVVPNFDDNTSGIAAKNERPGSDEQTSTAHVRITATAQPSCIHEK